MTLPCLSSAASLGPLGLVGGQAAKPTAQVHGTGFVGESGDPGLELLPPADGSSMSKAETKPDGEQETGLRTPSQN